MKILIDGQTFHTPEIDRGIGVYVKNTLQRLLATDYTNEFYVTLADEEKLAVFPKWYRQKLNQLKDKAYSPPDKKVNITDESIHEYHRCLNADLKKHHIDIYWNPNPLMGNVFLPPKTSNAFFTATIHDLIPLVMRDMYLSKWETSDVDTYMKKINILSKYDKIFCVSKSTEKDVLTNIKSLEGKTQVIYEGVGSHFKPYLFPKIYSKDDYVMYTGGFDPRKNMFTALKAFGLLCQRYEQDRWIDNLKFYIVCAYQQPEKDHLLMAAERLDIRDRIVLTGSVSDQNLLDIYKKAKCLFFPSLYEGFGLPVLEALACGTPVACSHIASLPELGKDIVEYFDPDNIDDMADALYRALTAHTDINTRLKRHEFARRFSWEKTASGILTAFQRMQSAPGSLTKKRRKKIAWLSPLPPQVSGIANYSYNIIGELKKYADIDVYYDSEEPEMEIRQHYAVQHVSKFENHINSYDEIFYHIGNDSRFHTTIYKLAWEHPGTVVLHDWNIHPFLQHAFLGTDEEKYYTEALLEGYGKDTYKSVWNEIQETGYPDVSRYPMSDALVKRSQRVIVHNHWAKQKIGNNGHVDVIPQFTKIDRIPGQDEIDRYKRRLGIDRDRFLVSCLGFINKNKLPDKQITAINKLLTDKFPVTMVFAGEVSPEMTYLMDQVNQNRLNGHIIFTGYQNRVDYYCSLFASDIMINMRYPSLGETSHTLLEAFVAGIPSIVNDTSGYREFPDNVCLKIPVEHCDDYLYETIKYLLIHHDVLRQLSINAKEYSKLFDLSKIANQYLKQPV